PAADFLDGAAGLGTEAYFLKNDAVRPGSAVVKQQVALRVSDSGLVPVDLGKHLPVGQDDVLPAVVIVIEEFGAEGREEPADIAETGHIGDVRAGTVSVGVIEVHGIV